MDLTALQTTLREFSAERGWQPFHTPKNLAMALMVEAGELAEIFQWMTPEQSQSTHDDPVLQERIADEVADVMLYLLQIADHTKLDLKRAIGRKLVKNAKKHAPLRPGLPAGPAMIVADTEPTHVLVDWENVQPKDSDIRNLVSGVTDVWLFHGPGQKKFDVHHASFGERATAVPIARTGKNALDFHLSFYMGYIAARQPAARFVVMSNDKGYGPMLDHALTLGFAARQVGFGQGGKPAAKAKVKTAPAKKAGAVKGSPAVKAVAGKTAPSKPAPAKGPAKKAPPAGKTLPGAEKRAGPAARSVPASPSRTLGQAIRHVQSSLTKTSSRPTRSSRLLATIGSLLGVPADDADVRSVVAHLLAAGTVAIDDKGAVHYAL